MFSKMTIFIFVVLGAFTLLFASMTTDFYANQGTYTASAGTAHTAPSSFDVANVTIYDATGADNMTYPYTSLTDAPAPPQWTGALPDGQYLEVWWSDDTRPLPPSLEFRHTTAVWWGYDHVNMLIYYDDGAPVEYTNVVFASTLETAWDATANASVLTTKSPVTANYLIQYNQSKYVSITDAWNNGELGYEITYQLNLTSTSLSIWGVVSSLLTFNAPALGLTGTAGLIVNGIIAVPFWIITAILIIKLVQSIIPFIGGTED